MGDVVLRRGTPTTRGHAGTHEGSPRAREDVAIEALEGGIVVRGARLAGVGVVAIAWAATASSPARPE